jgi:hypothetical protein
MELPPIIKEAHSLSLYFLPLSLSLSLVPLIAEGEREMVIIIIKKRIFRYIYIVVGSSTCVCVYKGKEGAGEEIVGEMVLVTKRPQKYGTEKKIGKKRRNF